MFGAGFTELLLIFIIGLLILGPERLPRVAAQIGRWIGRARRTANQLRYQLEREIALEEVTRAQKKQPSRQEAAQPPADAEGGAAPTGGQPGSAPLRSSEADVPEAERAAAVSRAAAPTAPAATAAESDARVAAAETAPSIHPSPNAGRTPAASGADERAGAELEPPAKQSTGR